MPLDDPHQFLFAPLTPGREGAQCAFSVRAISYIFHGWAHYKGPRKLINGKPDDGVLYSIPFEKLGLFWCRLWGRLWDLKGCREQTGGISKPLLNTEDRISCPPPFKIERAKHGKRPQRHDGVTPPIPLIDVLYQQQELGIRFFDIRPYITSHSPDPSDYRTQVHATVPFEMRDNIIKHFNSLERKLLGEIDEVIRHLGASEIRALGTHESLQETIRDVEWEYDCMRPHISRLLPRIEQSQPFGDEAQDILEFADEAHRKSHRNRMDYKSAHERFANDLKDPSLKQAFEKCQHSESVIWENTQMQALMTRSEQHISIAKCLRAVDFFSRNMQAGEKLQTGSSKVMEHYWQDGVSGLRKHGIMTLPPDVKDHCAGASKVLKPQVLSSLLQMAKRLQT